MSAVQEGREALGRFDWPRAHEILSEVDPGDLDPSDLDGLADAAWWLGLLDECISARERAYERFLETGDTDRAAMAALAISLHLGDKGAEALAGGWRARAYRLVEDLPASAVAGYLLSLEADAAFHAGQVDECITKSRESAAIGRTTEDPTLVAWGTHLEGLGLLKKGHVAEAWARLDESMVASATGTLKPVWEGLMHCGMLLACEHASDPQRGWHWVKTTEKWLESVPGAVLYRGVCRIHKVHFMQLRGVWPEAEAEAWSACEDLMQVHVWTAARGYYEIAEIRRLKGDLEGALELYRKAHGLGWDPQPGLAQLRLAQGRVDAAAAGIRRALDEAKDRPSRAGLLPHQVEIALMEGDVQWADDTASELASIASDYESPGMTAAAATATGAVLLAKGDARSALGELRKGLDGWLRIDCPYDGARTRVLLGKAYRSLGDQDGAAMEFEAAAESFRRLGAEPDARRVHELLGSGARPGGLSEREVEVLRLIAGGSSNKEIAAKLSISENTVARHVSNIFVKLDVPSRSAATSFALKQGIA